jgi:uncharacterized membrane protein YeaQ/YmgE (transglycosylase-associated protein family)
MGLLLTLFVIGIIAGYLARLLVMGPDPMGFFATALLGIAGSFIGGTLGALIFAKEFIIGPGPLLLAIPGAVIALLIYRKVKFGEIMPPRDRLRRGR